MVLPKGNHLDEWVSDLQTIDLQTIVDLQIVKYSEKQSVERLANETGKLQTVI